MKKEIKAPKFYLDRGEKISSDVIRKTTVPSDEENVFASWEITDPISDRSFSPVKGVVHRHRDRVLFMPTSICGVYCRFCLRRETVGEKEHILSAQQIDAAIDYIRDHNEIWEVIFSGGDPLMLSNDKLQSLFDRLAEITHVKVIRIHTRFPVINPKRVNKSLIRVLRSAINHKKAVYLSIHVNHVEEIDEQVEDAMALLADNGIILISQTVLLKGVNDTAADLGNLFRRLIENRVKPYYLHHLDLAQGTSHFRTTIAEGQEIMTALRNEYSGLCLPTYVLDIPGGFGKVPIIMSHINMNEDGKYVIKDCSGKEHLYPVK